MPGRTLSVRAANADKTRSRPANLHKRRGDDVGQLAMYGGLVAGIAAGQHHGDCPMPAEGADLVKAETGLLAADLATGFRLISAIRGSTARPQNMWIDGASPSNTAA